MTLEYYSYLCSCYFRNTNIFRYLFGKYIASKYIRIFIRYMMWHPNMFRYLFVSILWYSLITALHLLLSFSKCNVDIYTFILLNFHALYLDLCLAFRCDEFIEYSSSFFTYHGLVWSPTKGPVQPNPSQPNPTLENWNWNAIILQYILLFLYLWFSE